MKDNEQSRFFRWGIPGWVMFLAFLTFSLLDIVLSPDSQKNSLIESLTDVANGISLSSTASAVVVLLVAASGIPLGFLIYQIYFYIRWNSPFARDGLFPPFIIGRWDDLKRILDGIDETDLAGNIPWKTKLTSNPLYQRDHGWKSRYIENSFLEIVQHLDSELGGVSLYGRSRYLMDLMHTLGAGLFGVYLGYLAYLLFKAKADNLSFTLLIIASTACLFILVFLLEMEDKLRKRHQDRDIATTDPLTQNPLRKLEFLGDLIPSAIYMFLLFAVLYLGSPSPYAIPYTQLHVVYRSIVLIVIAAAWAFSQRPYWTQLAWREFFTFLVFGMIAYLISQLLRDGGWFREEWWRIGWVILLFLFTNLILTKNRQNIHDDLIALQNYTLKRYLYSDREKPKPSIPME